MTTPYQSDLTEDATHLNQGLFSDYYLDEIVPTLPEWNQDGVAYQQLVALRASLRERLEHLNPEALDEAQLEEHWVRPVLKALGHHWSVQIKIRYRDKGFRKPDYVFTRTQAEAEALSNAIYDPAQIAHTLAVGDAKRWGAKLDQSSGNERNPSEQIDEYLRYSQRPWGILTDGRIWRLYHRESSKDNAYYAVDLPALLTSTHDEANTWFQYFYLFFRAQAFERDAWLETILQQSVNHAEKLSERLEDEVYEALTLISQGFLNYRRNRLKPETETLGVVYANSLIFLYRLLFILYAESRNVLPMEKDSLYAQQRSLQILLKDAFLHELEGDSHFFRRVDEAGTYERLSALFLAIDQGDEQYDVSPYNGRLFSDEDHPFLADKRVGDAYLLPALDRLARVDRLVRREGKARRVLVDYRDLDVRHLGAIYEKLLEYELDVALTDLTVTSGKYKPASGDEVVEVKAGELYLRTGNNERKITGSYYTPDYIVRFIVERTLEPLLTEITARHADLDSEGHWRIRDGVALRAALLGINILDPATGSGHFMVGAVAYIAEWLRRLALHPADMDADEDELVYWKRQVVTNSIYGVDVNPLAVELAKLSLWLTTLAKGRPLSFLDHHVRAGNTLVGELPGETKPPTPEAAPRQLFDPTVVGAAVHLMDSIETAIVNAVSDVKGQERSYADLQAALAQLRRGADTTTYVRFNAVAKGKGRKKYPAPVDETAVKAAAEEHRFFHWGLAFPEVFYNADGTSKAEGGFDAVIGNPPYVRYQNFPIELKRYLHDSYQTYDGSADLYLYFFERGLRLTKPHRRIAYITSGTYMNSDSASRFRQFIKTVASFEYAINFGENQPFKDAEMVLPTIAVLKNSISQTSFRHQFIGDVVKPREKLESIISDDNMEDVLPDVFDFPEWRFQSPELTKLARKVINSHAPLSEQSEIDIHYGILTGKTEVFIIDSHTKDRLIAEHQSSVELIYPSISGKKMRPWYQKFEGEYLICARQGIDIESYPAILRYLENHRRILEPKPADWDHNQKGKWPGRSSGLFEWYEWTSPVAYFDKLLTPKICWSDISKLPRFSYDDKGTLYDNTVYGMTNVDMSLLALLQSRVTWFAISQIATPLRFRGGLWQYRLYKQFIERLPIPKLTAAQESTLGALAEEITALAGSRYSLHESARHRIGADLGAGGKLNEALGAWWELPDLTAFREQVKRSFKAEVPVRERSEWESWLREQQAQHHALTDQIIDRETRLNAVVYQAFELLPDEIALVERATKYPYGAV